MFPFSFFLGGSISLSWVSETLVTESISSVSGILGDVIEGSIDVFSLLAERGVFDMISVLEGEFFGEDTTTFVGELSIEVRSLLSLSARYTAS